MGQQGQESQGPWGHLASSTVVCRYPVFSWVYKAFTGGTLESQFQPPLEVEPGVEGGGLFYEYNKMERTSDEDYMEMR